MNCIRFVKIITANDTFPKINFEGRNFKNVPVCFLLETPKIVRFVKIDRNISTPHTHTHSNERKENTNSRMQKQRSKEENFSCQD